MAIVGIPRMSLTLVKTITCPNYSLYLEVVLQSVIEVLMNNSGKLYQVEKESPL